MFIVFFRTLIIYIIIIICLRIMGKRQLGELQPSEFVIAILISNIATLSIEDTDIPLLGAVVPIITLMSAEVVYHAEKRQGTDYGDGQSGAGHTKRQY